MDQLSERIGNMTFMDRQMNQAAAGSYFMPNPPPMFLPSLQTHSFPAAQQSQQPQPVFSGPGLDILYSVCRAVYANQQNPLQCNAVQKIWLGGPDPLDFISMYSNPGDPANGIPAHWHYISFGLSDLYGDGRIFEPASAASLPESRNRVSGYGFELTFRLKKEQDSPPTWPATVMQSLAKYVFNSDNALCPGDHVSWHCSLDNSESRIQHMLMTEDPQLGTVMTPFGSVTFVQVIGVCAEELQAAQQWNGTGLIGLMKAVPGLGGSWLVTDMRRRETIFEIDSSIREAVDDGIAAEGSNLSGVTAKCSWKECDDSSNAAAAGDSVNGGSSRSRESSGSKHKGAENRPSIVSTGHEDEESESRATLSPAGRNKMCSSRASRNSSMSTTDPKNAVVENTAASAAALPKIQFLKSVHLTLNLEAGNILPLAVRGRLKHGRHFTFKTVAGDLAVTMLTEAVSGAFANMDHLFALHGPWLQILIPSKSLESLMQILEEIPSLTQESLPKKFSLPDSKFCITIAPDDLH